MALQLIQIAYWLALATWFGGVVFVAVAAPIIFKTVREHDPTLPRVLSVNLEGQHSTLLAGSIVGNILEVITRVQLVCAGVLLLAILAEWVYVARTGALWINLALRSALYLASAVLLIYNWRVVWPRIARHRQSYIDNADDPDIANPAKEQFDRYHQESVTLLLITLALLLGMILFTTTPVTILF
jgi:hypothetical protein